jgi:hypothetical protein
MSISSTIRKTTLFLVDVPFLLLHTLVFVLTYVGAFDFLYSWPLVLSYLFFLLLTVLIFVPSRILRALIIYLIIMERYCTRLVYSSKTPKARLEGLGKMRHVKDRVVDALLDSVGAAVAPLAVLVLRGIIKGVYPPDASPLFIALFPWSFLWKDLVWRILVFRSYRYAEGLSFREALQEMMLYMAEKKFGSMAFLIAVATLAYWFFNWIAYNMSKNPWLDHYHVFAALLVPVSSLVVLAVVLGWALDVFTRRLFGEALGKFLFATFVVGAVFHPFLGLLSTFFFSWALFGRAKDAAAATAIAALSLFAVMLPELIWTSVLLL